VRVQQVDGIRQKTGNIEIRTAGLARIERENRCLRYTRSGKGEKGDSMAQLCQTAH
jgi:hypothetical protein